MDINKYVSLAIGIAVIAIVIGVMGPVVAQNLLPTGEGALANADTINTILQLLMLFVPIIALLAIVRGAIGKS